MEDETWVFDLTPEMKQKPNQQSRLASPVTNKFKETPSAGKVKATDVGNRKGILLICFIEHGQPLTHTVTMQHSGKSGKISQAV